MTEDNNSNKPSSNGNQSGTATELECFVIMPISDPDGYKPGHFQRVYEDLFVPACESAGYRSVRADQVRQTNLIHLDVLQKIIDSPMAICDLSTRNPNVMFELGLRQAFDKPVVLVQEVGTPPIFDITPLRYAEYHNEMFYRQVKEDQEKIANAITATKEAINNSKSVNSIVKLLSLTHGASLATLSEGDKDTALLQVIMTEISNLRTEVRDAQGNSKLRNIPSRTIKPLMGYERLPFSLDTLHDITQKVDVQLANINSGQAKLSVEDYKYYSDVIDGLSSFRGIASARDRSGKVIDLVELYLKLVDLKNLYEERLRDRLEG